VPGVVHLDLMAAKRIPDAFYGLNELDVQWVGECDWLYRCAFSVTPETLGHEWVDLCFDGLDTFATVWLNGEQVLVSDNMFVPQRVSARPWLQAGQNQLHILFESAWRKGKEIEARYGRRPLWNGDWSRLFVLKAQYHYGWDWGPALLTAGPWRCVRLEAGDGRISQLDCPIELSPDLKTATLPVTVTAAGAQAGLSVELELIDPGGQRIDSASVPAAATSSQPAYLAAHTFAISAPQLWWPIGYGRQPQYRLAVTLVRDGEVLDRCEQRLGLRRLRLLQEPLAGEPGTTFLFEVNNTPIFCGGANWIPADSFTPRLTPEHYGQLVRLAAEAHMTMLRVWGGGIYEDDVFYDFCDELGLLVWQDFMFACGLYPAHAEFQASVRAEAETNVRRLRHHPSLALWCGNNEDYSIAASLGAYDAAFDGDFAQTRFPGRAIYERLLPAVCAALDPVRPYWPGSPYGGPDPNSQTVGDRHTWDVWHGVVAPYHNYPKYEGRFVSEFGMLSFPALRTIESYAAPADQYPQSRTVEHHNKADGGVRRMATYVSENVRLPPGLGQYVYASQFVQAEAPASAYRGWRRRWGGPGRYAVAGALVWQLDDCWPASSWAIVDSAVRVKPAYYAVRRELAPVVVGFAREIQTAWALWASNCTGQTVAGQVEISGWDLNGGLLERHQTPVSLLPNQATELGLFAGAGRNRVLSVRLLAADGVVARAALWPEPFKYISWPDPQIALTRTGPDLVLRAARPAKGVWLEAADGVAWSDNFVDLMPGEDYPLTAVGLGDQPVSITWLGHGDAG
jgi:beta-mannosidase